jgi:hypothetical protein
MGVADQAKGLIKKGMGSGLDAGESALSDLLKDRSEDIVGYGTGKLRGFFNI